MTDAAAISRRFALDPAVVEDLLLDHESLGLLQRVGFADLHGWSHAAFVPLNRRILDTITCWQIRPSSWDAMSANDHTDWGWDERVLRDLGSLGRRLRGLEEKLSVLPRFAGYADRFEAALGKVDRGDRSGSTSRESTPATLCGSSCTRTCWPRSA